MMHVPVAVVEAACRDIFLPLPPAHGDPPWTLRALLLQEGFPLIRGWRVCLTAGVSHRGLCEAALAEVKEATQVGYF
jgi:hypothetical protein